jgi:hypothetical protein
VSARARGAGQAAARARPSAAGSGKHEWLAAAALLALGVIAFAPHVPSDTDTLSRLAMGRWLWQHGLSLPASDPFTFATTTLRFGDPEWLGDLLLLRVFQLAGPAGLQISALALGVLGYWLALGLSRALEAGPRASLGLLLVTLPVVAPRINARNDLHALWILPAFAWLLTRPAPRLRTWLGVFALALLWANLHGSFVLGAPLLMAAALDRPSWPKRAPALALLCIYPALPWFGLAGASPYVQLIDHVRGAEVYRGLLSEWQSPLSSPGVLAILPLYGLALIGTIALWRIRAATRVQLTMFVLGLALAYGSRRFLPLMAAVIAPACAPSVSALGRAAVARTALGAAGRMQRIVPFVAWTALLTYFGLGVRSAAHRAPTPVFDAAGSAEHAAHFIAAHAGRQARLANAFNDGAVLTWRAPDVPHYLDPRNNLGAAVLDHYVREVLLDPAQFQRETERLAITLLLVRERDPSLQVLQQFVASAPDWQLVYWDGHHALYARRVDSNRDLIAHFGFRVLEPRLSALPERPRSDPELQRDLTLLDGQAPPLAAAVRAFLLLRDNDPSERPRALAELQTALPVLNDVPPLLQAFQAAGLLDGL